MTLHLTLLYWNAALGRSELKVEEISRRMCTGP